MTRKFFTYLVLLGSALGIGSCDPYRFNMSGREFLQFRILSDFHNVSHTRNSIDLLPGGCVVMTSDRVTQFRTTVWIKLDSGTGIKMLVRPRVEETILDSGYVITMTTGGTRIDSAGKNIARFPNTKLKPGAVQMLSYYNEEGFLQIVLGCDTLMRSFSSRMAPDDIVFSSMEESSVHVYAPDWHEIDFNSKKEVPDQEGQAP